MVDAAPFCALRYDPAVAGDPVATSSPAYDELERFTYAHHRTASPYTVLELIAASGPSEYRAAGSAFRRWRRTGVIVEDPEPAFYRYEIHELRHGVPALQRGLLAAVRLEALEPDGLILPHEQIEPGRVDDRLERVEQVPVDLSPVYAFYRRAPAALQSLLAQPPTSPPILAATDPEGTDHRVWALRDAPRRSAIASLLADVGVVIADGHHRYAKALAFRDRCRQRFGHDPEAPWERVLMYLVDAQIHGPRVHAVHRRVAGFTEQHMGRLGEDFHITQADPRRLSAEVEEVGGLAFGLLLPGDRARLLVPREGEALRARVGPARPRQWRTLDAAVLSDAVLQPLGLSADAVVNLDGLVLAADEAVFVVRPVSLDVVADHAEARVRMPPKTTHFRPKPRTGLVMRALVDDGNA